jgi:hypothetical protein
MICVFDCFSYDVCAITSLSTFTARHIIVNFFLVNITDRFCVRIAIFLELSHSIIATARVQPPLAPLIFAGKQATLKP